MQKLSDVLRKAIMLITTFTVTYYVLALVYVPKKITRNNNNYYNRFRPKVSAALVLKLY